MGQQVILALAHDGDEAGAWMLRSDDTLYGRHWGCLKEYDNLHFEACFYQGIEYCIANGLNAVRKLTASYEGYRIIRVIAFLKR